jgi:hypothetical protein
MSKIGSVAEHLEQKSDFRLASVKQSTQFSEVLRTKVEVQERSKLDELE